jgi:multiple sugar transport system substrate-binding protein
MLLGKKSTAVLAALLGISLLAGCGGGAVEQGAQGNTTKTEPEKQAKPVTLTMLTGMEEELFRSYIADTVKKRYPYMTVEQVPVTGQLVQDVRNRVTANSLPDIILGNIGVYSELSEVQVFTDLTPFIKKYNFDMNRLRPELVQVVKDLSGPGKSLFIPADYVSGALFYNKDIFDKFGVPYPKDGMTWDQTIELAKSLTRQEGGMQYRGLDLMQAREIQNNQMGLTMYDTKADKVTVNTDGWKKLFEHLARIYKIDGNGLSKVGEMNQATNMFIKDRRLAMFVGSTGTISQLKDATAGGLNWDVVTMPYLPEAPNVVSQAGMDYYVISNTSKLKDEAFMAIDQIFSDEVQVTQTKMGKMTPLKNEEMIKLFAADVDFAKGKNTGNMFKTKAADTVFVNKYLTQLRNIMVNELGKVIVQNKDINTALRDAQEAGEKKVAELNVK